MEKCFLCPKNCGINRNATAGFCGADNTIKIARAALHFWEEPCISGEKGSGTIFFSHCTLKCIYCQNSDISRDGFGKEISMERLAEIFFELQKMGAHNINLVTPTHYAQQIKTAVQRSRQNGLALPIVWNTSGYEKAETVQRMSDVADVWLTDFKTLSDALAQKYLGVADYPAVAKKALEMMVSQTGEAVFDEDGMMKKGVIVRHLALPGCIDDSKDVLKYLFETYGHKIFISLMNQYTPPKNMPFAELERTLLEDEYDELIDFAVHIGIENGFIQEGETQTESFIPPFDLSGV